GGVPLQRLRSSGYRPLGEGGSFPKIRQFRSQPFIGAFGFSQSHGHSAFAGAAEKGTFEPIPGHATLWLCARLFANTGGCGDAFGVQKKHPAFRRTEKNTLARLYS